MAQDFHFDAFRGQDRQNAHILNQSRQYHLAIEDRFGKTAWGMVHLCLPFEWINAAHQNFPRISKNNFSLRDRLQILWRISVG